MILLYHIIPYIATDIREQMKLYQLQPHHFSDNTVAHLNRSDKYQHIQIDEQEYNTLKVALETEDEIVIEPETPVEEEPEYIDPNEVVTIDYVKSMKTAEMSNTCNKVITNGFDVVLSDGNSYHFSLTTQDQLNG